MSNTTAALTLAFVTLLSLAADCASAQAPECIDRTMFVAESDDVAYTLTYTVCTNESDVAPHAGQTVICLADNFTVWSHPSNAEAIVELSSVCGR